MCIREAVTILLGSDYSRTHMREYYGNVLEGICQHANINLSPDVDPFAASYDILQPVTGAVTNLPTDLDWLMFPQMNQNSGDQWDMGQAGNLLALLECAQSGGDGLYSGRSALGDCM